MEYTVVIPSYDRSDVISSKTLNTLKKGGVPKEKIFIFVANDDEYKKYNDAVDKSLYNEIVVGVIGLVEQRKFINDYFEEFTYIISFDDDVEEILEKKGKNKTDKELTPVNNLVDLFKRAYDIMKEKKFFIWGVAPVNNPFFLYDKVSFDLRIIVGPIFGYINRDDADLHLKYGPNKEDTERTCRYYKKDGGIIRFNNITIKTKYFIKGGINSVVGSKQKRFEQSIENAKKLYEEFPTFGKIIERSNTGLIDFKLIFKPKEDKKEDITYYDYRDPERVKQIQKKIYDYIKENPNTIPNIRAAEVENGGKATRGDKIGEIGRTKTFGYGNKRNLGFGEFVGNKKYPELYKNLIDLGNAVVPVGFFYNAITFNVGVQAKKHTDGLNNGFSVITGFGDYTDGKLRVYNKEDTAYKAYDIKNKGLMFDGNLLPHETEPFKGLRITVIYYKQKYPTKLEGFETVGN